MNERGPEPARRQRGKRASARGVVAEAAAAAAYAAEGWCLRGQRVRSAAGEIDLVMERAGLVAFVEVKARASLAGAAAALGARQRARLLGAGAAWLAAHPEAGAAGVRFDVVLVAADGALRRVVDAFREGDGGG